MPILCSPVKSRLSARSTGWLTQITFFRCLSRKRESPIWRYSRWPLGSLTQIIKRLSHADRFCPHGKPRRTRLSERLAKITFLTSFPWVNMKSRKHLRGGRWRRPICCLCVHTHKRTPIQPPTDCSHVHAPLEALKLVERVKGTEPSLSAWEADNEGRAGVEREKFVKVRWR